MRKNIVCAEKELSIAANNIAEYGEFLARIIDAYIKALRKIQLEGIQDELVYEKLSDIIQRVQPLKATIPDQCEQIASSVRSYISAVERADNFKFPVEVMQPLHDMTRSLS